MRKRENKLNFFSFFSSKITGTSWLVSGSTDEEGKNLVKNWKCEVLLVEGTLEATSTMLDCFLGGRNELKRPRKASLIVGSGITLSGSFSDTFLIKNEPSEGRRTPTPGMFNLTL